MNGAVEIRLITWRRRRWRKRWRGREHGLRHTQSLSSVFCLYEQRLQFPVSTEELQLQ